MNDLLQRSWHELPTDAAPARFMKPVCLVSPIGYYRDKANTPKRKNQPRVYSQVPIKKSCIELNGIRMQKKAEDQVLLKEPRNPKLNYLVSPRRKPRINARKTKP